MVAGVVTLAAGLILNTQIVLGGILAIAGNNYLEMHSEKEKPLAINQGAEKIMPSSTEPQLKANHGKQQ